MFTKTLTMICLICCAPVHGLCPGAGGSGKWTALFNGRDLDGWTPKIRGYELGDNFGNTFRVEDGVLKVVYDQYEKFDDRFGHLFYKQPFSHYRLRVEYRFVGEQVPGGAGWALRNSGIMIHGQSPESMAKDQSFPVSIEVQLLGGTGRGVRPTANLCTPGTHVVMDGKLWTPHCTNSSSKTYHGDQWVTVELEVRRRQGNPALDRRQGGAGLQPTSTGSERRRCPEADQGRSEATHWRHDLAAIREPSGGVPQGRAVAVK